MPDAHTTSGHRDVNTPGLLPGRLPGEEYSLYGCEAYPPLTAHQATLAAAHCLGCHDAPCVRACPTGIDVPEFIARIGAGNPEGAAAVILAANPFGGVCARVCPTEVLCEAACVRSPAPVEIAGLQRYATDIAMRGPVKDYFGERVAPGRRARVAVVGAGPAGLTVAQQLGAAGHEVVVADAHDKPGGLNEYGLAGYKVVDGFPAREIQWLLAGLPVTIRTATELGRDFALSDLLAQYDAVFLGVGLPAANFLRIPMPNGPEVRDAVAFLADVRQRPLAEVPIGRAVVVIGGGPTAVDAAVAAKLLGAREVTIAYRRGRASMKASLHEQEWAASHGVTIREWLAPTRVSVGTAEPGPGGRAACFAVVHEDGGELVPTGEEVRIPADLVLRAIGQRVVRQAVVRDPAHSTPDEDAVDPAGTALEFVEGRIAVDLQGRTSVPRVWAGGDCTTAGPDLTVTAVAAGMRAAASMAAYLSTDRAGEDATWPI